MESRSRARRTLSLASVIALSAPLLVATVSSGPAAADPEEPLGARPYLGWSSYSMQVYSGAQQWLTADQIMAQSDAMHETLQDHGYEYINVDAGWNGGMDEYGRPVPNETVFPDGIQAVIDHVHDNGQKFGLYLIPGISPDVVARDLPVHGAPGCTTGDLALQPPQQGDYWGYSHRIDFSNPCAQPYIDSIADQLAEWGVDFIKLDSVTPGSGVYDLSLDARGDVAAWSQALGAHDIWLELSWALDITYADYWKEHAQGWRVHWDVECYCAGEALTTWDNIARLFPTAAEWWRHAGPGGWNDFDSINVGNGSMDGLTKDERRTAMTFWAVSAVPLYVGNDLTNLDDFGVELLTNPEVIAVNQAGRPARPVSTSTNRQVWYALKPDGTYTVAVFNLGRTDSDITVDLSDIGLDGSATVRDLWERERVGSFDEQFVVEDVPIHGARLFEVTPGRGSVITVNDDDLRVAHDGEWLRNGNQEVPATSQPLTLTVGDSSTGEPPAPAAPRPVQVNDDDPALTYTGAWNHSTGRGFGDHNDDVHWAESDDASVEYTFVGTGIDYVTELHASQGDVEIYIDGALVETVDTYQAEGRSAQQVAFSIRDLPNGRHTFRAVKSSGQFMLVDRLDVVQEALLDPASATFDKAPGAQEDVSISLLRDQGELDAIAYDGQALEEGTDYTIDGNVVVLSAEYLATLPHGELALDFRFKGDHLDDVHATSTPGDSVEFTFRGTGVSWAGPMGPDQGEADVYLDGELIERVDTSSETRLTGRGLFSVDGLRDREHTLRVVMVSGEVMRSDAISYTVGKV